MEHQTSRAAPGGLPRRRRALRVGIGAAILLVSIAGTVVAQGPLQPDGSEPAPPFVEPEIIPQPDGSKPVPPFVAPEVIPQPPNPHPKLTGASTQIAGPREKTVGIDGQGAASSKRNDTGGVDGADRPGGRTD